MDKSIFLGYAFMFPEVRRQVELADRDLARIECADDTLSDLHLLAKIESRMRAAHFCLFDMTSYNVNVATEYGFARSLGLASYLSYNTDSQYRPDDVKDIFSDLRGMDSVQYSRFDELSGKLRPFLFDLVAKPRVQARDEDRPLMQMTLHTDLITGFIAGEAWNAGNSNV